MSAKKQSENILKTKGSYTTPHFASPKLKNQGFSNAITYRLY